MKDYKTGKVVLDFYANWCGQCKMLMPKVDELANKLTDYKFIKVDVDKEQEVANEFNVTNLPTFIILEDGKEVKRGGINLLQELDR